MGSEVAGPSPQRGYEGLEKRKRSTGDPPGTPFFKGGKNPSPPPDPTIPNVKPDPRTIAAAHPDADAKAALPDAMNAQFADVQAIAHTSTLAMSMGEVGDRDARWKFLDTLDGISDPAVRAKVKVHFQAQTGQSLEGFIKGAGWNSARDKEQALDLISTERDEAAKTIAELPEAKQKQLRIDALGWAQKVLAVTRKNDVDNDVSAKAIFDALGPRKPHELEAIRKAIRDQTGGKSIYREIDRSLSGGTENEAIAGLKGDPVKAAMAGIANADGNAERVQELLRGLDPTQLAEMKRRNPMIGIIAANAVEGSQREEVLALVEGKKGLADGAHVADLFEDPKKGFEMDGIKVTRQSEQNLENRRTENVIDELRSMTPDQVRKAREAWNAEHPDKPWSKMIQDRFGDGDSTTLLRIQALADGNKVEERSLALRHAMRSGNQKEIEAALANPELTSKDPTRRAIALAEKAELEIRVIELDRMAQQTTARMQGKDPDGVVPRDLDHQLADYYKEYGDTIPQPKDFESVLALSDPDKVLAKRQKEADEDSLAAGELDRDGKLSMTTGVRRAEATGDSEKKAQLLEGIPSTHARIALEKDYQARYGKDLYADPQQAKLEAFAKYKQMTGDERPLEDITIAVADEMRSGTQQRIHNVDDYGAKVERSAHLEYVLQKDIYDRQYSGSLESSERMREMYGGNVGTQDLARHQLALMDEQLAPANGPYGTGERHLKEGVDPDEYNALDKNLTNTLEVQRAEKVKHGERLAMIFSTVAKIGALLTAQPHLVALIDLVAGLTEMAIKSETIGSDYDSTMDAKMLGVTMLVDTLTIGAAKLGVLTKLDDVAAAEKLGQKTATDVAEHGATNEVKKELVESGAKQVAASEAKLAGTAVADDAIEGGMGVAKAEQAAIKLDSTAVKATGEVGESAAKKAAMNQPLAYAGVNMAGTVAGGVVQGQNSDDMLVNMARGLFAMLIPGRISEKVQGALGNGNLGKTAGFLVEGLGDAAISGGDVNNSFMNAAGNRWQKRTAKKPAVSADDHRLAPRPASDPVEHPYAYVAEDPVQRHESDADAPGARSEFPGAENVQAPDRHEPLPSRDSLLEVHGASYRADDGMTSDPIQGPPMDPEQFSRMKRAFERQGGIIAQDRDAQDYLSAREASAVTFNEKTMALRENPTASEVFEEFIHTAQYRTGRATGANVTAMEIEAAEKLIRNRRQWNIHPEETKQTIDRLRRLRQQLAEGGT